LAIECGKPFPGAPAVADITVKAYRDYVGGLSLRFYNVRTGEAADVLLKERLALKAGETFDDKRQIELPGKFGFYVVYVLWGKDVIGRATLELALPEVKVEISGGQHQVGDRLYVKITFPDSLAGEVVEVYNDEDLVFSGQVAKKVLTLTIVLEEPGWHGIAVVWQGLVLATAGYYVSERVIPIHVYATLGLGLGTVAMAVAVRLITRPKPRVYVTIRFPPLPRRRTRLVTISRREFEDAMEAARMRVQGGQGMVVRFEDLLGELILRTDAWISEIDLVREVKRAERAGIVKTTIFYNPMAKRREMFLALRRWLRETEEGLLHLVMRYVATDIFVISGLIPAHVMPGRHGLALPDMLVGTAREWFVVELETGSKKPGDIIVEAMEHAGLAAQAARGFKGLVIVTPDRELAARLAREVERFKQTGLPTGSRAAQQVFGEACAGRILFEITDIRGLVAAAEKMASMVRVRVPEKFLIRLGPPIESMPPEGGREGSSTQPRTRRGGSP